MVCFFIGRAFGSYFGSLLYDLLGWYGFIMFGGIFITIAFLAHIIFSKKEEERTVSAKKEIGYQKVSA